LRLSDLLHEIEIIEIKGDPDGEVRSISYHSGRCEEGGLFVAIPGLKTDGHTFIDDALAHGARFIIHERGFAPPPGVTAIRVQDSRQVLGRLARNFFGHPSASLCLIAVIGTNGKTTITYLLESILRAAGHSVGILGTVDYRYGDTHLPAPNTTPESFEMQRILREMADHGVTHVVAEISSHAIALRRVDDCAFDLGIFTNLTQDHLDYHGTMENYFRAKLRFFTEVLPRGGKSLPQQMVINNDDPWGRRIIRQAAGSRLTYGLDTQSDVTAVPFCLSIEGIEAKLRLEGETLDIVSNLMGRFNLYNILAAAAAARAVAIPSDSIRNGIAGLSQVPGRLEKVSAAGQPAVFVDYAHTDDALRRVLQNLSAFRRARIITVFGCGGDLDRGKRPLMGEAATTYSDLAIVTSDNPRTEDPLEIIREIETGIRAPRLSDLKEVGRHPEQKGYLVLPDRREAIRAAIALADAADIVLIAGKGHEDYQIVGSRKLPFDDRAVARERLALWPDRREGS
jgi:UDP-N-acetylmuramoyl-L-alanyl-D-glutamate--2,6-diaminopimelate ligase